MTRLRNRRARPLAERLWEKVDRSGGPDACWPYLGKLKENGYAAINRGRRGEGMVYVHRAAYEIAIGPVPEGLTIDHVRARGCTMRHCCNPAHLEAVSRGENTRRGEHPNQRRHRANRCIRGHDLAEHGYTRKNGTRACTLCATARQTARRAA